VAGLPRDGAGSETRMLGRQGRVGTSDGGEVVPSSQMRRVWARWCRICRLGRDQELSRPLSRRGKFSFVDQNASPLQQWLVFFNKGFVQRISVLFTHIYVV